MSYNPLRVSLENIIPLTEARDHFSQIVNEVQKDKLYVLTKGGKPAVAIIDVKYLEHITGGEAKISEVKEEIEKAPEKVGLPPMVKHDEPTPIPHTPFPPKPAATTPSPSIPPTPAGQRPLGGAPKTDFSVPKPYPSAPPPPKFTPTPPSTPPSPMTSGTPTPSGQSPTGGATKTDFSAPKPYPSAPPPPKTTPVAPPAHQPMPPKTDFSAPKPYPSAPPPAGRSPLGGATNTTPTPPSTPQSPMTQPTSETPKPTPPSPMTSPNPAPTPAKPAGQSPLGGADNSSFIETTAGQSTNQADKQILPSNDNPPASSFTDKKPAPVTANTMIDVNVMPDSEDIAKDQKAAAAAIDRQDPSDKPGPAAYTGTGNDHEEPEDMVID